MQVLVVGGSVILIYLFLTLISKIVFNIFILFAIIVLIFVGHRIHVRWKQMGKTPTTMPPPRRRSF